MPPQAATDVERVFAGLQQAAEGLAGWRQAAEAGAAIEPDELARLQSALERLGNEFRALHDRFQVQLAEQEPAQPAPATPSRHQASPAVVEALIATLSDPDHDNWRRALWGLGHGVPEAQRARVVEALVDLHNNRSDPGVRQDCADIVRNYGGAAAEARLLR